MAKTHKILVIEDETNLQKPLTLKLHAEGYETEVAGNGDQAMKILKTQKDFSLIILDLIMPQVNGFEVLRRLKEQKYEIPILVLSNLGQTEDKDKIDYDMVREYFVKSDVTIRDVVEKTRELLSSNN
jgi:DNA-binding response OmpR family regulator